MRILVDYRAALRARTGVGAYIHELIKAYTAAYAEDAVAVFTSSWKDRPAPTLGSELGATVVDTRIPVRVLNYLWHRAEWPSIETLAGAADVAHSAHPLLLPARRAHAIITSTQHARRLVSDTFGISAEKIYVCSPGPPVWRTLGRQPNVPDAGTILFVGTLEPRKNIGALLDAYETLLTRMPALPRLVLAGQATADAEPWLARLAAPPLAGRAVHLGYVADAAQEQLYADARVLVLPSLDEGFGLPALAAMSAGVPVIASRRGALPEVVATGGILFDPEQPGALAAALERVIGDAAYAAAQGAAGLLRARAYDWSASAAVLRQAYTDAIARRQREAPSRS